MLLLAVDTSGKNGAVTLGQCQASGECKMIETVPLAGGTFSAQLVPQIASLLEKHSFKKQDIGGLVVVSGPGSFTGLRVGLAAVKGLAEVLETPIAAVSLLEAVPAAAQSKNVLPALDGGRGEIYVGDLPPGAGERLVAREEFLEAASGRAVATPDESVASLARAANCEVQDVKPALSAAIVHLGWSKIQRGETVSPVELEANYIRRSDAEIFAKAK